MNHKLIMLPNPILVSNEEIEKGDWFYYYSHGKFNMYVCEGVVGKSLVVQNKESSCWSDYSKKIIAGIESLPKLDLSDIAEEIGWVDVEKLALKEYPVRICDSYDVLCHRVGDDMNEQNREHFIKGLKKALELTADRIFTEEDMKQALFDLADVFFNNCQKGITEDDCKKYQDIILQSLSKPKEYLVEVEMEDIGNKDKVYNCSSKSEWIPKITNNTIKVTKIINQI